MSVGSMLKDFFISRSIWVATINCGSCNGCDSEIVSMLSPVYDMEKMGIKFIGSPKHADMLLVTGSVNGQGMEILRNICTQLPRPCKIVAVGACACSDGIFKKDGKQMESTDRVVTVDNYVAGCSPTPDRIMETILATVGRKKHGR